MKTFIRFSMVIVFSVTVVLGITGSTTIAATTPNLGTAATFGVLATTFNHNIATTTIYGNLGYVGEAGVGPIVIVGGATFVSGIDPEYLQAEADQDTALLALNNLVTNPCTFTFAPGITDLAADDTHDVNNNLASGVYEPGVYCTAGSATTAAVTLSGAGTYIFRIAGSLDMVATTNMTLTNGASACNVFWTPTAATTIGANANFIGTVIGGPGITIGNAVSWTGRALASNYTVTADTDTIIVPNCTVTATPGTGTLHVVKDVINLGGGTAVASDFVISVHTSTGAFVASGLGLGTPGTTYLLSSGTYTVSEPAYTSYTTTFSLLLGDCLNFDISSGDDKICTVLNTYIIPAPTPSAGGGSTSLLIDNCPSGDYSTSYYDGICGVVPATASQSIHIVKIANRLIPFPYGGGDVIYTYAVTNPDPTPISNLVVTDDKCGPVTVVGGDVNNDHLLDTNEVWMYTCGMNVSTTTRNIATVTGRANGVTVSDTDFANVVVGPVVPETPLVTPKLPKTGITPALSWSMGIMGAIFLIFSVSFVVALRKRNTY